MSKPVSKPRIRLEQGVPISAYYLEKLKKYASRGPNNSRRYKVVTGTGPKVIYPFAKMKPGDSFVLPLKKVRNPVRMGSNKSESNYPYEMRSCAKAYGEVLNKTFLVLKDDNHQWRCYCVENAPEIDACEPNSPTAASESPSPSATKATPIMGQPVSTRIQGSERCG